MIGKLNYSCSIACPRTQLRVTLCPGPEPDHRNYSSKRVDLALRVTLRSEKYLCSSTHFPKPLSDLITQMTYCNHFSKSFPQISFPLQFFSSHMFQVTFLRHLPNHFLNDFREQLPQTTRSLPTASHWNALPASAGQRGLL